LKAHNQNISGNGSDPGAGAERPLALPPVHAEAAHALDADLAATTRYATDLRRAIARLLVQAVKLSEIGCSTSDAEETLQALRGSLHLLERHERYLLHLKQRA
jgi:hypothetical protein